MDIGKRLLALIGIGKEALIDIGFYALIGIGMYALIDIGITPQPQTCYAISRLISEASLISNFTLPSAF